MSGVNQEISDKSSGLTWLHREEERSYERHQQPQGTTMSSKLTPTQHAILTHALAQTQGKVLWFPDALKGGAKDKVTESLRKGGYIAQVKRETVVTKAGYEALGLKPPFVEHRAVRTRETSKQATVINMLNRTEGATIDQICEATGWQPHTVRGAMAGALKKKLGLDIQSFKESGGARTYRIAVRPEIPERHA
jgi:hypothetical protein